MTTGGSTSGRCTNASNSALSPEIAAREQPRDADRDAAGWPQRSRQATLRLSETSFGLGRRTGSVTRSVESEAMLARRFAAPAGRRRNPAKGAAAGFAPLTRASGYTIGGCESGGNVSATTTCARRPRRSGRRCRAALRRARPAQRGAHVLGRRDAAGDCVPDAELFQCRLARTCLRARAEDRPARDDRCRARGQRDSRRRLQLQRLCGRRDENEPVAEQIRAASRARAGPSSRGSPSNPDRRR